LHFVEHFGFAITVDADLAFPRVPKDTSAADAAMRRSRWYLRWTSADGVPRSLPPNTNRIGRSARKPCLAAQAYGEAALSAAIRSGGSVRGLTNSVYLTPRRGASSSRVEPNSQNRWSSPSPVGMWAGCL